ncbi:FMN reductase [Pararobbsia silviterrae]|uniref:FMN reductase n=1 Tax=Pararobbsia silviterrae TaxID=1792498 RepID=A0A494Y859_9BURK|nr:FMN reductase [Pararobbsia silviterrae]RKP58869.1 FMN reductase [Pararobbsia silviterrae]
MSHTLKVVAVSGGLQRPSRTLALVQELVARLGKAVKIDVHLIELGEIASGLAAITYRSQASADIAQHLDAIESADVLIVASPVFRGSFTGLFKHLFDLVHHEALIEVPVLLAATGGSDRHALVIDHQLRPLFSFFQSRTLPIGVYASEADFSGYAISSPELNARIDLAVSRAVPWLHPRAQSEAAVPALAQQSSQPVQRQPHTAAA